MPKYIVKWDAGYGESYEAVEAKSQEEANDIAYDVWKQEAENNAVYSAELLTPENAEEHGLEHELEFTKDGQN